MSLVTIQTFAYKGHEIAHVETYFQAFFVIDGDLLHAYWSMADAKRAINGHSLSYEPVSIV